MGDKENEFRKKLRDGTNDRSKLDKRSAQQRAIDGLEKMTPRNLETIMNQSNYGRIGTDSLNASGTPEPISKENDENN